MDFIKQSIKQALVDRQHKKYESKVRSKNLTYDDWIKQQEEANVITDVIKQKKWKSLTNDFRFAESARNEIGNDGYYAKIAGEVHQIEFISGFGQEKEKKVFLSVPANLFCHEIEQFLSKELPDMILLTMYEGEISEIACNLIAQCFCENKNTVLIYGDEDIKRESIRENPWFKPDWSPDRFLSSFYFGGLVAVRTEELKEVYESCKAQGWITRWKNIQAENPEEDIRQLLYLLLYKLLEMKNGFDRRNKEKRTPAYHIRQVLYHSKRSGWEQLRDLKLPKAVFEEEGSFLKQDYIFNQSAKTELSVIIPSKDNPDVLFHCLNSFMEKTDFICPFEILIIDNGSNEENRKIIQDKILQIKEVADKNKIWMKECRYIYHPMEFNFSRMCNLGAEGAEGKVFLFLNDDMEIIQPNWMELMLEKALLPRAGAVGAKLLYPDSDIIQHAGITNLRVGPAHKLQFLQDEKEHYFGMNRGVHNMLAVTGACLMVRREVFVKAEGFYEGLAVAFNDVDLCYNIYEQGYYNIVRNDVVFYHHESLSRGKDGESAQKQLRLLKEKDILYERHQDIYGKDPYYHPCLTSDMLESEYSPACRYQVTLDMPWSKAAPDKIQVPRAREDRCLVVGMECAMDIYKWQYGVSPDKGRVKVKHEEMGYYFQGYSFVIGADNACYKKSLLLKNQKDNRIWIISLEERYRKDIRDNLKDQLNVDLTGFAAKLRREEIPEGIYQFGILAEDKCSRQKLVNWSSWVLEVAADGK